MANIQTKPGGAMGKGNNKRGEKAKNTKGTLKRLYKYLNKHTIKLIFVFILTIISSISSIAISILLKPIVDDYIIPRDFNGLFNIILFLLGITLINIFASVISSRIMNKIAQITVRDLRRDVFNKLVELPIKFYDTHSHGDLMSKITNDLQNVMDMITNNVVRMFSSIITLIGVIIAMFRINISLTFILVLTVPITVLITAYIAKINKKQYINQQEKLGELNGHIEEYISGQYVVKAFNMEEKNIEGFENVNEKYMKAAVKAESFGSLLMPLSRNLNGLGYAVILVVAGVLGVRGTISVGDFTSFTNLARQFGRPINEVTNLFSAVQLGLASAERCFEIIDEEIEVANDNNKVELTNAVGEVKIQNIDFSYNKDKQILHNISIDVKPGEMVALVGSTGAGKTTIINLLTRFYDVDKGKILIDGIDIKDITRKSLRENLGIVLQDTVLFSESVYENILYGKLDATDEEVKEAAKNANASDFIERLTLGYETEITEDGGNLSVGQRQLLNISRVFINQPKILILDEATSNVDTRTEVKIQEAMRELMKGRTTFVIAHRLSTIRNADKIIVLEGGRIVEAGNHEELVKQKGRYYELYTGISA